jgi:hypothetical protein
MAYAARNFSPALARVSVCLRLQAVVCVSLLAILLCYYCCSRGVETALPMLEAGASLPSLVSPVFTSAAVFGQSDPPVARTASRSSSFVNHLSRRVLPRSLLLEGEIILRNGPHIRSKVGGKLIKRPVECR